MVLHDTYVVNGYSYLVNRSYVKKNGERVLYLQCRYTVKGCSGKGVGINKITEGILDKPNHPFHFCKPDPIVHELLKANEAVRQKAVETKDYPATIINDVLTNMSDRAKAMFEEKVNWTRIIC